MNKPVPFTKAQIEELSKTHETPFYIYDEAGIRAAAREIIGAFSWNKGFKQFFAVKALPNPEIVRVLKEEGCGVDCSSLAELVTAQRVGLTGEEIILSSNDTPAEEFIAAKKMGAIINLDDITHLEFLEKNAGLPDLISCRYNPGGDRESNAIIGKPGEAKFGITKEQLFETYRLAKEKGVRRFGLHTMVASNLLNVDYFIETARTLFDLVLELREQGIEIEFVNLGGGVGIPYRPEQEKYDFKKLGSGVRAEYEKRNLAPLKIQTEYGRFVTGPHGYLVSRARHIKNIYKKYVGLDACMADLMRPGMYGAYHHITVLGKENIPATETYDVTGSLCENNDKFAIDRKLPKIEPGDIVVIHDAGAHSHAMGFNYNGKLRHAELLMNNNSFRMIRRAETLDDYFATLTF